LLFILSLDDFSWIIVSVLVVVALWDSNREVFARKKLFSYPSWLASVLKINTKGQDCKATVSFQFILASIVPTYSNQTLHGYSACVPINFFKLEKDQKYGIGEQTNTFEER